MFSVVQLRGSPVIMGDIPSGFFLPPNLARAAGREVHIENLVADLFYLVRSGEVVVF